MIDSHGDIFYILIQAQHAHVGNPKGFRVANICMLSLNEDMVEKCDNLEKNLIKDGKIFMDQMKEKNEIVAAISKKIREDKEFEKLLFSNPRDALKVLGIEIPKEINVKILREEQREFLLVIPHKNDQIGELTDLQLRHSSGGRGGCKHNTVTPA
ncbi:MAG: NHLP leader peptide family RiPP precursor [Parachlamydiaceae bacterium]